MQKAIPILVLSLLIIAFSAFRFQPKQHSEWHAQTPLHEVLYALGNPLPTHAISAKNAELVKRGKELVHFGRTTDIQGQKTKRQSPYFVCTDCHNTKIEDPILNSPEPEPRLAYAIQHRIPFLPGTTLKGIVNRVSWYNDDYFKKYGKLVENARDTLIHAIQLCAVECSQGRALSDWELQAVLHYFWSIAYNLGELKLSDKEWKFLQQAKDNKALHKEALQMLFEKYAQKSPATFTDAPYDKKKGYEGITGNPKNGAWVYEKSCMFCHENKRLSTLALDYDRSTFRHLLKNLYKHNQKSVYQAIRYGTSPLPGHKPYMPHYTQERLNDQQAEDLVAYIKKMAE